MINLLPPKEKEELISQQKKKLAIILWSAFLIAIICLILVLLSVKFYILGKSISQKFILEQVQDRHQTSDFLTYKDLLQNYNKKLIQLRSFYEKETEFSSALKNILEVKRPEGVYFTELFLNKKEDNGKIEAKIYGTSDTRENLLIFKKNFEERPGVPPGSYPEIKNYNFSPESWIYPKSISFYLTFEINGN